MYQKIIELLRIHGYMKNDTETGPCYVKNINGRNKCVFVIFDGISPPAILQKIQSSFFILYIFLPVCSYFESLHITLFRCILSHLLLFFKKRPMINYAFDTYIILFHSHKKCVFCSQFGHIFM